MAWMWCQCQKAEDVKFSLGVTNILEVSLSEGQVRSSGLKAKLEGENVEMAWTCAG